MTHEQLQQIRAIVYDAYCEGDTEAEWMLVVIDAELAKPEQEPVGCKHFRYSVDVHEQIGNCLDCGAEGRMRFVVPAPETQPVAYVCQYRWQEMTLMGHAVTLTPKPVFSDDIPLYTHPMPEPAAPEQQPVAWVEVTHSTHKNYTFHGIEYLPIGKHNLYTAPVAAPQQPVSMETVYDTIIEWSTAGKGSRRELARRMIALFAAPQREWQSLTPDEINNCAGAEIYSSTWAMTFARAIEAALKEKNHG